MYPLRAVVQFIRDDLADRYDLLLRTGGVDTDSDGDADEGDADAEGETTEGSGSTFKLKPWKQRRRPTLGIDPIAEEARQRQQEFAALGEPLFDDMGPTKSSGATRRHPAHRFDSPVDASVGRGRRCKS